MICNTTVSVKAAHFQKFADLIGNQFNHGGEKYALPGFEDREATDVISAVFGGENHVKWILGTMMKYLFRFNNFEREKDLLKIATYCYILWLKKGFHLALEHDEDTAKDGAMTCSTPDKWKTKTELMLGKDAFEQYQAEARRIAAEKDK